MRQHIKTSLGGMRRAPFQVMAAVSVLAITFFVSTLMVMMVYSSQQVLKFFETRPQVLAFIKDEVDEGNITSFIDNLTKDEKVKDVNYVSKEQAFEIYKDATSDNPLLAELVSPSVFPASVEFSLTDLNYAQEVIEKVQNSEVVDSVSFTANIGGQSSLNDAIARLKDITYYLRIAGLATVAVLAVNSFLVLMVVIGMRVTMKRKEIESLTFVGATPWFIKAPIIFEALSYAFLGVLLGWLGAFILLLYVSPTLISYFGGIPVLPSRSSSFFILLLAVLGGEFLVGAVIALLGSLLAVSRSLRMVK
jgi:cell division transport system permease protein